MSLNLEVKTQVVPQRFIIFLKLYVKKVVTSV